MVDSAELLVQAEHITADVLRLAVARCLAWSQRFLGLDPVDDVIQQRRAVLLVKDVLIGLQAKHVNDLLLRQDLLGDSRLWQEDRESVRHIALFHKVSDQANCNFECQSVLCLSQIDIHALVLQS